MKSEIKVVAIVLVALIVFLSGFGLGASKGINITVKNDGAATQQPVQQQQQVQQQVQQPVQQQQQAQQPQQQETTKAPAANTQETTKAPAADNGGASTGVKVPGTTDEVCAAYNKAINDYRAYKGTVTLHKVENTQVNITELPSIAKPLEGTINSVISGIVKPVDETFTFSNGVDVNDSARYIEHKMIPVNRDATVTSADVVSATAAKNADGGYTITLQFVAETSSYDGKNTTDPVHHMTAMDPLNLATLKVDPIKINSAEMKYSGATTKLTVDSEGRLIKLENYLPLEGSGTGGMGFIEATIGLAGHMESTYTLQYA